MTTEDEQAERDVESDEKFIAEHGLPAFLDHIGLDGAGNEVMYLKRVEAAAKKVAAAPFGAEVSGLPELRFTLAKMMK